MTRMFESLPNEIWLILFSYLSSQHIWGVELLEDRDNNSDDHRWQAEFVSHAHAICLKSQFHYEILTLSR
ncbi:unnamed protein product [Rotaria sordida]|uniref:Uncharacterized protein n=1 Tax=Rotaria sordida TaxID=392033 RepID=A0A819ZCL5_9BILA|nr:unnamed protein product [Rotaria sordida]